MTLLLSSTVGRTVVVLVAVSAAAGVTVVHAEIKIKQGTKTIVMELPRLNGFTTDSRPYEISARTAVQDITKPSIVELNDIDAKVEMKDGQHVTLKSGNGIYDAKGEVLQMNGPIVLTSSSGYEARLSEATVNVASGSVVSESPVEVKLPNGTSSAGRLRVMESGAVVIFSGGVEMSLNPEQARPAEQPAPRAPASADAPAQADPLQIPCR